MCVHTHNIKPLPKVGHNLDILTLSVMPAVLVIAGTTSVGKTDLSLELAKLLNGEVISADSAQVRLAAACMISRINVHFSIGM